MPVANKLVSSSQKLLVHLIKQYVGEDWADPGAPGVLSPCATLPLVRYLSFQEPVNQRYAPAILSPVYQYLQKIRMVDVFKKLQSIGLLLLISCLIKGATFFNRLLTAPTRAESIAEVTTYRFLFSGKLLSDCLLTPAAMAVGLSSGRKYPLSFWESRLRLPKACTSQTSVPLLLWLVFPEV